MTSIMRRISDWFSNREDWQRTGNYRYIKVAEGAEDDLCIEQREIKEMWTGERKWETVMCSDYMETGPLQKWIPRDGTRVVIEENETACRSR